MATLDDELDLGDVFIEPERPPSPEPTTEIYTRPSSASRSPSDWSQIQIRLVGSHPLWGHHLWNAARVFATFLETYADTLCKGKNVLELGAGGALPSIVAALEGARRVVVTDYPDHDLVKNMSINIEENVPPHLRKNVSVQGYIWGTSVAGVLNAILSDDSLSQSPDSEEVVSNLAASRIASTLEDHSIEKFDLILMSDLVFNHSQHDALLTTCEQTLRTSLSEAVSSNDTLKTPLVLVFYTHHRPHLAHRDLNFFTKARERGWVCEEILQENMGVMFPEDSGDVDVRSTVHGWKMYRSPA